MLFRGLFAAASFFVVSNLYAQAFEFTVGDKSASLNWGTTIGATNVGQQKSIWAFFTTTIKTSLGKWVSWSWTSLAPSHPA